MKRISILAAGALVATLSLTLLSHSRSSEAIASVEPAQPVFTNTDLEQCLKDCRDAAIQAVTACQIACGPDLACQLGCNSLLEPTFRGCAKTVCGVQVTSFSASAGLQSLLFDTDGGDVVLTAIATDGAATVVVNGEVVLQGLTGIDVVPLVLPEGPAVVEVYLEGTQAAGDDQDARCSLWIHR